MVFMTELGENRDNRRRALEHDPRRVVVALLVLLMICVGNVCRQVSAQTRPQNGKPKASTSAQTPPGKQKDEYHRPEPTRPFTPQIPGSSRNRPDKVFLEYADSMVKPGGMDDADKQVVIGNVKFRQMGMWMFCDSAWYFPEQNSMDAFGHVRMEQGDTLFVYADKLFYDGTSRFARLRCGVTEPKVRMHNREVKLTTDSLDYDLRQELGWYAYGGELEDDMNTLTSEYGEYSPSTKNAAFYHDVVLTGTKNDFELTTDTLYYNTDTHIARIETLTEIHSTEDDIITTNGFYNTDTGVAELLARSIVMHTDSLNRTTTLEGDSIVYDPTTRISRAYSFRNLAKHPMPMVITDTVRKATLIGGFGIYNDSTREAMATEYPLMMEYSRGDTLFLRADTIETRMFEKMVPSYAAIMNKIAADSLRAHAPDSIGGIAGDSVSLMTIDSINTVAPADSLVEWHMAMAYPRARFFRKDLQGVADTIIYTEIDSILRLKRLPIVWNEERQVRGDTIIVHLQDSTADWARIPSKAMLMEHVEEDFYNQLHSDKMMMYFVDGGLERLEGEGSVQAIILPMENDSTYNRLVDAESSYLTINMKEGKGNELEKLKMWPEVTGNVTPLFMVKKSQKLLPGAVWLEALRPRREWYGGSVHWADDLGELPEELEKYFEQGENR